MHVLVTGASGFVGAVLARRLVDAGHRVTALVRDASQAPEGCGALCYVLGSEASLVLPAGIDAVAHLAQSRSYRTFPADAGQMFRVNVLGAQALFEAAAGVSRFCLVSTGTVYEPFDRSLVEDAALSPTSYLGASKLAAEVLARPFCPLFPISILRLFGPYGPGQTGRLVPDLIRRVRAGDAIALPEVGGGMRFAPTYVDDICDVMITALREAWSGVFNVAKPDPVTIEQAAMIIGEAVGREPVFERKPLAAPVVVPDVTRLGARYDLSRLRSFPSGIATTLASDR